MNVVMLSDRVMVRTIQEPTKSQGGIFLPGAERKMPGRGIVVAYGPGKLREDGTRRPPALEVGQEVVYEKWQGSEVEVDGKDYKILSADEIMAVLNEDE